eukprot:1797865-Rhodomonas_salina.1
MSSTTNTVTGTELAAVLCVSATRTLCLYAAWNDTDLASLSLAHSPSLPPSLPPSFSLSLSLSEGHTAEQIAQNNENLTLALLLDPLVYKVSHEALACRPQTLDPRP